MRGVELARLYRLRFGQDEIPDARGTSDYEAVVGWIKAVAGSLGNPEAWASLNAPWLAGTADLKKACRFAARMANNKRGPRLLSPDATAKLVGLTFADRQKLRIQTIGSCDVAATERKKRARELKRAKDRDRQAEKRRKEGIVSRAESASATKPWEAEGISRATWYRRQKLSGETTTSRIEGYVVPFKVAATELYHGSEDGAVGSGSGPSSSSSDGTGREGLSRPEVTEKKHEPQGECRVRGKSPGGVQGRSPAASDFRIAVYERVIERLRAFSFIEEANR